MPLEILRQQNWNGGELDPAMLGRRDLKAYFSSAAHIENLIALPQGPLRRRPGMAFVDRIRRELTAIDIAGATLAAPSGGTAASAGAIGGDVLTTTTAMEQVDPYVVLTIDLGAATEVAAVDCVNYGAQEGGGPVIPPWEYPWDRPVPGD